MISSTAATDRQQAVQVDPRIAHCSIGPVSPRRPVRRVPAADESGTWLSVGRSRLPWLPMLIVDALRPLGQLGSTATTTSTTVHCPLSVSFNQAGFPPLFPRSFCCLSRLARLPFVRFVGALSPSFPLSLSISKLYIARVCTLQSSPTLYILFFTVRRQTHQQKSILNRRRLLAAQSFVI